MRVEGDGDVEADVDVDADGDVEGDGDVEVDVDVEAGVDVQSAWEMDVRLSQNPTRFNYSSELRSTKLPIRPPPGSHRQSLAAVGSAI